MNTIILSIQSEISHIEYLLTQIPEENIIEKLSFQHRLEVLTSEMEEAKQAEEKRKNINSLIKFIVVKG